MKLLILLVLTVPLQLVFANGRQSSPCKDDAVKILRKYHKNFEMKFESSNLEMILTDLETNKEKKRLAKIFIKNQPDKMMYLVSYFEPVDLSGTAMLYRKEKESEDQWVYSPVIKNMRRITSGKKSSYFMGSDFTFHDFSQSDISQYNYRCLRYQRCSKETNNRCAVIEESPKNKSKEDETGYNKVIYYIDLNKYFSVKQKYYNDQGLIKTMDLKNLKKINGDIYRASTITMTRPKYHMTTLRFGNQVIDQEIPEEYFTERHLIKNQHMR